MSHSPKYRVLNQATGSLEMDSDNEYIIVKFTQQHCKSLHSELIVEEYDDYGNVDRVFRVFWNGAAGKVNFASV